LRKRPRRRKSDSALGSETQSETGSVKDVDMGMCNVPSEYSKPLVIEGIEVGCVECS
jgi:L-serine/L-threonine ammonia-lyase